MGTLNALVDSRNGLQCSLFDENVPKAKRIPSHECQISQSTFAVKLMKGLSIHWQTIKIQIRIHWEIDVIHCVKEEIDSSLSDLVVDKISA